MKSTTGQTIVKNAQFAARPEQMPMSGLGAVVQNAGKSPGEVLRTSGVATLARCAPRPVRRAHPIPSWKILRSCIFQK